MSHPLRLRQLEALMAVTHHGSMTRGAQEVRFLLPDIRRVLETMHQISEASQNITDKKAGHLRIACLPGFATSHLPGIVAAFLRDRPGVSVTLEPDRPERILEWMVGEQYDFGITDGFEGHPAVESEHIDICTVCVFPEGHRLASLKTIGAQDLANENLIHTRRDSAFFRDLNEAFQKANTTINSLVESRQFTAACEMVCQGIGVSVVSAVDAAKYVGQGLDHRPFTPSIPHRLSLVRPTLKQPSMISLEFMEVFSASLTPYKLR